MNEFEGFVSNFKTPYIKANKKKEEDQPKFKSNFIANSRSPGYIVELLKRGRSKEYKDFRVKR